MIISMTGYGKGESTLEGSNVIAEVRTVNHRFIDFSIRLPRGMNGFEKDIEKIVRRRIRRGYVHINITWDKPLAMTGLSVNSELLAEAFRTLSAFAEEEGIPGKIDINTLLLLPDAFANDTTAEPSAVEWNATKKALGLALDGCLEMRKREGEALLRDIEKRIGLVERAAAKIERRAPAALKQALVKGRKRIKKLLADTSLDEARWAIEAAIIAERTDFSEEIVRLRSHVGQFKSAVKKGGEVAKRLTFLLQEIHREATTMANKASDSTIINECLTVKEAGEKLREQVQNLE